MAKEIKKRVDTVKSILGSLEDGEITLSAYDTAWVALVEDVDGSGTPQFPASLEWIAKNQLEDGSWGDEELFSAHDRILNTLACVIALKSWNIHPEKCEKGSNIILNYVLHSDLIKANYLQISLMLHRNGIF